MYKRRFQSQQIERPCGLRLVNLDGWTAYFDKVAFVGYNFVALIPYSRMQASRTRKTHKPINRLAIYSLARCFRLKFNHPEKRFCSITLISKTFIVLTTHTVTKRKIIISNHHSVYFVLHFFSQTTVRANPTSLFVRLADPD